MSLTRREALIGAAALSVWWRPARLLSATRDADDRVRAALDSVAALPTPAARLARLAPLSTTGLSHGAMLDLVTARAGLAVDVKLARAFPHAAPGQSPYRVGPSSGSWRDVAKGDDSTLPQRIDSDTRQIVADADAGIVLPQPFLDRTVAALRRAAAAADGGTAAALDRQAAALDRLRARAAGGQGVWRLPNGAAYYALLLERCLGEPITAQAAHRRLLATWHALAGQAGRLLAAEGFAGGSVGDRFRAMFAESRWHYPDSSAGRDQLVAAMNVTLDRARARVPELIGPVPPFCLAVRVRRMSPAEEAAKKGGYRIVATPTRPGAYFVDMAEIERRPSWSLGSVVHHELLPGHMIQMPIELAAAPHPLRLDYAPAFPEGWGIYGEALSADTGAFAGNRRQMIGYLHWMLFRIGRGIADTGIHHARWSRDRALAELRSVQGEPAYFAPFEKDVDRICLDPGIRAAEALTWLRLADLRRAAGGSRPGAAMCHFHQVALADGRKRLTTLKAELGLAEPTEGS